LILGWGGMGCGKQREIQVYSAPREPDPPVLSDFAEMLSEAENRPTWEAPPEWAQLPTSSVRKGSFEVRSGDATVDISVTSFPGDVGGEVANVQRWARLIELEPNSEREVIEAAKDIVVGGIDGRIYQLETEKQATVVCWIVHAGSSWFFKMSGDRSLALAERDRFDLFLQTVRFPS
jgi:hypothetical protein